MNDRRVPIKQGGKIVGYVNPPLYLRFWHTVRRGAQLLRELLIRLWQFMVGNRRS